MIVLDSTDATSGVDVTTNTRTTDGATIIDERVDIGVQALEPRDDHQLRAGVDGVPDIPTVLWWSGARFLASRTFSGLAEGAATVVVDSSGKARGEETIRELGDFVCRFTGVTLKDLAFMRLLPWQDMIAQFFDDPTLREDLFSIDGLEIESGSDAEALYLAGWLGSRLSWEAVGRDAFRDRRGRTVPFVEDRRGRSAPRALRRPERGSVALSRRTFRAIPTSCVSRSKARRRRRHGACRCKTSRTRR